VKPSNVKRISKEDMARHGEVPKYLDPMLETLNTFIEQVTTILSGNLTFADNFLGKEVFLDFADNAEQIISVEVNGKSQFRPYAVTLADTGGAEVDSFTWRVLSSGKLGVNIKFTSVALAKCRLLIYLR